MIAVQAPPAYQAEREYIVAVLLGEFLGLDYRLSCTDRTDVQLTLAGDPDGGELRIADVLLATPQADWLTPSALPSQPLTSWSPPKTLRGDTGMPSEVPVIYGIDRGPGRFYSEQGKSGWLGLDVFGGAFLMLTRYEEALKPERDSYGRIPAESCLAFQEGFLERPIVNEYVELLWRAMRRLWPRLRRRERRFRVRPTHDVDRPFEMHGQTALRMLRGVGGDLLRRRKPEQAWRRLCAMPRVLRGDLDADVNNTFDLIMSISEQLDLRSTFYFLADDKRFPLENPWIRRLMKRIHARGHELGLHTIRDALDHMEGTQRAAARFRQTLEALAVEQEHIGGRQHQLLWDCPATWRSYADAGLAHDSTVGFADRVGFRCGVCYEYPVFDISRRRRLPLTERPLIAMEHSLLRHEGVPLKQVPGRIERLKERCRAFGGEFVLLWHNNYLRDRQSVAAYKKAVAPIT